MRKSSNDIEKAAIEAGSLRTKPYPQTVAERKAAWSDISSSGNSNDETNTARGIKQEAHSKWLDNLCYRELPKITDLERKARDKRILAGIEPGIFHESATDTDRPITPTYRPSSPRQIRKK